MHYFTPCVDYYIFTIVFVQCIIIILEAVCHFIGQLVLLVTTTDITSIGLNKELPWPRDDLSDEHVCVNN